MTAAITVAHVPTALTMPNDTLVTVATQLSRAHRNTGGTPVVVLAEGRDLHVDAADNLYVDYTRYCPRAYFTRRELAVDIAAGRIGMRRPYYGRFFRPAVEAVRARGVDAVLLYEGHYAAPSLPWWNELRPKTKVLLYVHNPLSRTYGRNELRRLLVHADGLIFCAAHLCEDAAARLPAAFGERLHVVHNGVDPLFRTGGPRELDTTGPFDLAFAGRVVPEKAPHLLLEAMAQAGRRTARPLRARIVGSSSYRPSELTDYERQLRARVTHERLDVEFVPFVDRPTLRGFYRDASAVCLPSAWAEGLPLAALEGMATGAPMIVSRSPGMVEACGDAAIYAPMGSAEGLADAIVRLADDPGELQQRSALSVARAANFTWDEAMRQILEIALAH